MATPALAQPAAPVADVVAEPQAGAIPDHHDDNPAIVVTAPYVRRLDVLAGTSVLSGDDLRREMKPQIGDTLTSLPGVSATSFTPGASRPVLRGFQGERVRVLTDGIGSIDVSNTSADHAVTVDPLTAERIEVVRGPAVLLFGSQAIGGAVNIIDRRIPRQAPDNQAHVDVVGQLGSAADERSAGAALDVALGGGFLLHVDGSVRKTDDLETGGFVLADPLRRSLIAQAAEVLEEGHEEEAADLLGEANRRGTLPNSAVEQKTAGIGIALIRDRFNVGIAASLFDTDYGVPMRPGAGHAHGDEDGEEAEGDEEGEAPVTIGLKQRRVDARGEVEFDSGPFDKAKLRLGYADYEHIEFEGEEVGTTFLSTGFEGRFEVAQRRRGDWSGASGAQFFHRKLDAIGAEAFVPRNTTSQWGLFTLQEVDLGPVALEAAARIEHGVVKAPDLGLERRFTPMSAALGASYELDSRTRVGVNISRSERAPSAEELYSDGPHIATQAYERGDPFLGKEKSWAGEVYLRVEKQALTANLTLFGNAFDDFIYQRRTGEEEDGLPVLAYRQADARFVGLEGEVSAPLARIGDYRVVGNLVGDVVRARLDDGTPLPRIPPVRLLAGIEAQSDRIDARIEAERVWTQRRVAELETPTDDFTLVNASLVWRPWGEAREASLQLSIANIFDVEARRHASFTKDFVPLAGRDIRLGARFSF